MTFLLTSGLKHKHHLWLKDEMTPAFAQSPMKCYHVSHSHVFPLHLGISSTFVTKKLSNFICEFVFIHMIKEWQLILCCKFLCCPKELSLILAVFCHESHVKLAYCFIHYRSRFIFSLPESIQILNMSRFDLTLCIPLALWLISLLFLEVIGELFPVSEWKSKHMLSGLWAFYRVC